MTISASEPYTPGATTAVLPVYNEERFIADALDSVLGQVDQVVVVDNCSTDRTGEIVIEYAARHSHLHYYRNPENVGSAINCRIGFQKVKTEFSFFLGGHDYVSADYVPVLKKVLQDDPKASLAYTYAHYVDDDGNVGPGSDQASIHRSASKNNVFRRAFAIGAYHGDCNLLNGLFRSCIAVPAFGKMGQYAGCDHLILFETALKGKLLYSREASYYRRMRSTDTMSAYMTRIVGKTVTTDAVNHAELDHVELVTEMRALLRTVECRNPIRRRFWHIMIDRVIDEGFLQARPEKRFFLNFIKFTKTVFGTDLYRRRETREKFLRDVHRFLRYYLIGPAK